MYIDPTTNQTVPWNALCTSAVAATVDWPTVCAMNYSANWPCCGFDFFNYLPCLSLWPLYGCLTAVFCWYSDIFVDFKSTVDELHHIQTQALGVVIARQKQIVMGKQVSDPRRLLMLLAMWTELPGFSFIPYQLLFTLYSGGNYTAQFPSSIQLGKFVLLTTFLIFYMGAPVLGPRVETIRHQVLAPFLFDSCFMTYLYSIVDVGGCANGMDQATWLGGSCGHPQHYWVFFLMALLVFVVYYWGTLQYKLKLSDQVFAVRFRFQTSFNSLMTFTRTACCLGFYTMQKLVLYSSPAHVTIALSLLNGGLFAMLLRYNYRMQPCLGVGRFPNNLRTLSFATSCYTSFAAFLFGVIVKAQGKMTASPSDLYVILALAVVYPVFALYVWRFNHRRATLFQVPNLSLLESLEHPTPRVRAIAAVCVTLEPFANMHEIELIVEQLEANLQRDSSAERFMVGAYTCQALWHLWFKYFHMRQCVFELDEPEFCLPFGKWKTVAAPRILPRLHGAQVSSLASRLWQSERGWLLTGTDHLRARLESFKPQTQGRRLVQLVQRASDIGWTTRNQKLLASPLIQRCFEKTVHMCAHLLRCHSPVARQLCAKLLHEMYTCECVRLTKSTMIAMMCILCGSEQETLAKSAVLTILSLFQDQLHAMPSDVVRLATTLHLMHMSEFVRRHHARNDNLSVRLLHFLIELIDAISPLKIEPPNYLCAEYVENLMVAQTECNLYSMHLLIDKHCAGLHAIYAAYMRQVGRQQVSRVVVKPKRSSVALTRGATSVVPLTSLGIMHSGWQQRRRGSSLLRRFGSSRQDSFAPLGRFRAPVSAEQYEAIIERKQIASTILADIRYLLEAGRMASTPLKVICRHRTARRVFSVLQRYPVYLDYLRDHITYLDYDYIRRLCGEMARRQRWQFFQPERTTDVSSRVDRATPGQSQWTEFSLRTKRPVSQAVTTAVELADME
ncbi:hypothetical protein SDRG_07391 [Saprolegnia diclina VS20]|uniref:Uncharacterized protein n=1 Tax=Saprolegnia diclina (strain VS20) TaxID=1156394 RepID=T0QB86_SAPDV|nr:hypothetical protein SDRG_07391 [Saprolegnia diclina VS20]EQC35159.1 hypothetical protein SDRG_07391 [Saprolegnia diclina VS20]|eukprot:XP_008611443.1 hypothetical protein SDRG_07391 [Saprolegnia diclina VS20]